jgi:hypothetical protein
MVAPGGVTRARAGVGSHGPVWDSSLSGIPIQCRRKETRRPGVTVSGRTDPTPLGVTSVGIDVPSGATSWTLGRPPTEHRPREVLANTSGTYR